MDDGEGGLSFDFEGGLDTGPTHPTASVPVIQSADHNTIGPAPNASVAVAPTGGGGGQGGDGSFIGNRRSFRQTVCRHWLRSLCMKGDACGFLHQYDKSRMPVCRFFRLYGECREQDCVYKHTNEDIKECNMYKLGFCPNGPDCRYRHAKLPGPPPPAEEVLQRIQNLTSYGYSNRFFQNRNTNNSTQADKSQTPPAHNAMNQAVKSTAAEPPIGQPHQPHQQQVQQPQHQGAPTQTPTLPSSQQNQADRTAIPLPQGPSRYFIVKSCNRENLELSVQQGVWATQRSNEAKLNEAFDSVENVILIFSINRTRHFQGLAKMTSRIGGAAKGGNWKHEHGTAHYGRNFSVKWLKLCELSFQKTRHLRNPYNENLPVKISRDCQELEISVGEQLASLLYLEPDSELMAISLAAESKREEERAKGVNPDNGNENPDIVPFEDNEEEEEEESEEEEEEDEGFGQVFGPAALGRGRGRGIVWPPIVPFGRGARPFPGMRGFPPGMMSDGFSYGSMTPDGFPMPDPFGMGGRPFGPFGGPRFPGEMMFHSRPPAAGGFGMMMGPGRPPFMGGLGPGATGPPRGGRPMGMHPSFLPPPPQPSQNPRLKMDQRALGNERSETFSSGPDQGRGQEIPGSVGGPDEGVYYPQTENSFRNDESESEDEAPRRSRHGDGKKKKHSMDEDATTGTEK